MQFSLSVTQLLETHRDKTRLDVRKPLARAQSGETMPQAKAHHPFDAANWVSDYVGQQVVVFCAHGHEVS